MHDTRAVLDTLMQSSTVDLFHSCGLAVAPLDRSRTKKEELKFQELTAMVSFTAPRFTGNLSVAVPNEAFALIKQDPKRPFGGRDWVREITNQLLGRIKSRLLQFGVTLQAGLPAVMGREALERQHTRGPFFAFYGFRTLRGEIVVMLSGDIDPTIFIYSGASNLPTEGDIIIF